MGKVMSVVTRKANRFNAENRAHRLLEKDKLPPAPKYDSNVRDMERVLKEDPDYVAKQSRKDNALDNRLKQVYVTSEDNFIDHELRHAENPYRPKPLERGILEDFEYGFKEPERVSSGRCTLRQAMKFITDNQGEPEQWTKHRIANEYKLNEDVVEKILEHFRSFQIHIPDIHQPDNILIQSKNKLLEKKNPSES